MKFRIVGAGVAVVLAVTTLSACRSNVGVAARVNGETISESQVTDDLSKAGQDQQLVAQAQAQGQRLTPARIIVLGFEIRDRLFDRALDRNGGAPSAAQLEAARDQALTSSQSGPPTDAQLVSQFRQVGISDHFLPLYLRVVEKEFVLGNRLRLSSSQDVPPVLTKAGAKVTVSPRYGEWDPATAQLVSADSAGVPGFVTLRPEAGAASSSAAPGN